MQAKRGSSGSAEQKINSISQAHTHTKAQTQCEGGGERPIDYNGRCLAGAAVFLFGWRR